MTGFSDAAAAVAERYERFAREEAPGRSELYADWASGVAGDAVVAATLARIPANRRQPPLVFAVTRMLGAPLRPFGEWAAWLAEHADEVVAECTARSVQTNEPLRCAALLPALSLIDGPIALLEVGASAGLCLYPDRYGYRYTGSGGALVLDPVDDPSPLVLETALRGDARPPLRMPDVVWRAGIDLQPLDARVARDRAWLRGLVWPGESGREQRIEAALDVAAADPPHLVVGNAPEVLAEVAAAVRSAAPRGATLVITTPGVLAHIPRAGRERVIALARECGDAWITLDAPALHESWDAPTDASTWPAGGFALALDGRILAAADPLGRWLEWRAGDAASAP
ncbi:DUF2332 domain-containing protein [Microbacterium sp. DT81.1]|uniref:DUF2332 domain-containing protein n=1 Tax=Microbacterium sp. DT81.1 TaxID=3393413 RepID=UPI003CF7E984